MKHDHALNPSALRQRAAAHRAMALAALRADSSLSVRLRRYNEHMAKARALAVLEAVGPHAVSKTTRTTLATVGMRDLLAGADAFASQAFED